MKSKKVIFKAVFFCLATEHNHYAFSFQPLSAKIGFAASSKSLLIFTVLWILKTVVFVLLFLLKKCEVL